MKWKYRTIKVDVATVAGAGFSTGKMNEVLNGIGEEGWELVTGFDTQKSGGGTLDMVLIFKMPLSENR